MARYDSILDTIGDTPMVKLAKLAPEGVNVYVKVESFNPMGSIKDRMALAVIEAAERSGELKPGQTVVEATSGNTGIGLAMVCARKGYPLVVTMAENFSVERRKMLRFLGAKVVLTPASEKGTGMLNKAIELAREHGWYLCRQFENEANAEVHYRTTAREILRDLDGEQLDYWVSGFGTGGTLLGCARAFKETDSSIRVVVAEPDNSRLLGSGIPQPRAADGTPSASHPQFRPHLMQGWSPDFVSRLTEEALDGGLIDAFEPVSGDDAMQMSRELARREGIFVGTSSGATLAAALAVARRAPKGSNVVCMLPDTGERYMSTPLFGDIGEEMNDEEIAISRSTPNYRFDTPGPAAAPAPASTPAPAATVATEFVPTVSARNFVDEVVASEPVVLFALEWCEFSWSIRKLFTRLGVAFRSVDLDSAAMQENDFGGSVRNALARRVGTRTIPQVFVGGELVGGCSETFDAYADGSLVARCEKHGIDYRPDPGLDARSLLPSWVHSRASA